MHPSQEILGVRRRSYLQAARSADGVLQGYVGGFDRIGDPVTMGAGYDFTGWGCFRAKF